MLRVRADLGRALRDTARRRATTVRVRSPPHVPIESNVPISTPSLVDVIAIDRALEGLAAIDARKAHVIELRFFAGLTVEETAQVLDVAPDTVARDWRMARSWLLRELDPRAKRSG